MTRRDYIWLRKQRDELRRAIEAVSLNPAASTSISAGGITKTITYKDLGMLQRRLNAVQAEMDSFVRSRISGCGMSLTYPTWCSYDHV